MKDTGGYIRDAKELQVMQSYPLWMKVMLTKQRIREWVYQFGEDGVVVSFSGGKDSTVLLHLVREEFPNVKAVFSNTGLEYPEIQRFVKSFDNVDIVTPSMNFGDVISTYGYPLIGKEVAEAIHYARRIRSQTGNVERERERERTTRRKQTELFGKRTSSQRVTPQTDGQSCKASGERSQLETIGIRGGQNLQSLFKRTELQGTRDSSPRRAGVVSGKTGEGGAFSSPTEQFGQKSMFNKEKWLPLAREAPFLISHYCCFKMKKSPMHKYQKAHDYKPFLATLAEESRVRRQAWIRHGCNAFESKNPTSQPMSFWTEQDVLAYIVENHLPIASVYGDIVSLGTDGNSYPAVDIAGNVQCNLKCTGCQRTGCIFCAFGAHLEKGETRFQRLAKTHPRQYEYCIGGGEWVDNPFYDPAAPVWDGEWKNWNPKKIWSRNAKGLGLGKVFDICNELYGRDFIRYE